MSQAAKKTAAGWKQAKAHEVTLPSGFVVTMEIPNLPNLVKTGFLPNELVTEALNALSTGEQKLTKELIVSQADFYNKLVTVSVKDPVITEDDVADLPFEDIEMIVSIATRQRDLDALGHHVGGLHTSKDWRKFRGFTVGDEDVAGASIG